MQRIVGSSLGTRREVRTRHLCKKKYQNMREEFVGVFLLFAFQDTLSTTAAAVHLSRLL